MVTSISSCSPGRILVVDDLEDNRELLQVLLEGEGYEVETAPEGYTAIAKIERQPPDLVLLDLMMPDLNGFEVAKWIEQNYSFIPVLFVSGCGDLPEVCKNSKLVVDFIHKPINFEELLEKIQAFVTAACSCHS